MKEFHLFIYLFICFSLVDNLPCATKFQNVETNEIMYEHGYRLGMYTKQTEETFLNNHLIMKLYYHKESE
jgi:transmembrane 9 superfamily protein 2/4